ncbi:MAG: fumarate hydratase, partial [Deltaproteobacteria bacterium]|nr:fumarate hydratase [Deltaproteobacteria bacterium]
MKNIKATDITEKVRELCMSAATNLAPDAAKVLREARDSEKSPLGKEVLGQIVDNFELAEREQVPMCQDTGIAIFFVDIGREVSLDGSLVDAINEGVRRGYEDGYLRKSVCSPFERKNTGDNTPAIIHQSIVEGDKLRIRFAPKGAGSENMSALKMLKPAEGIEGVKAFVMDTILNGGGNPCPPIVVGIGIGGNFERSAVMAKESLLRSLGTSNPDSTIKALEDELLTEINKTGIGPMGFGGTTTAIGVHIESAPCHIASLPVAINIQCHASRHKEV